MRSFYSAPEITDTTNCIYKHVDVFALGVIIWEMFCHIRQRACDALGVDVIVKIRNGERPAIGQVPETVGASRIPLRELIQGCWEQG